MDTDPASENPKPNRGNNLQGRWFLLAAASVALIGAITCVALDCTFTRCRLTLASTNSCRDLSDSDARKLAESKLTKSYADQIAIAPGPLSRAKLTIFRESSGDPDRFIEVLFQQDDRKVGGLRIFPDCDTQFLPSNYDRQGRWID